MIFIGPLGIHLYGIIVAIAVLVVYVLVRKRTKKYTLPQNNMENIFFIVMILSLIGARLYHVIDKWIYYESHPMQIIAIWNGGLGWYGAFSGGLVGILISVSILKINIFKLTDLFLPGVAVGQAIGRWGNYFNQEAFGPPTNLPWGVFIKPDNRPLIWENFTKFQPLFLYESIAMLLIGIYLLKIEKKAKNGTITALYCILYGIVRFILEFFRFDTAMIGTIRTAQILSVILILYGLSILQRENIWKTLKKE